MDAYGFVILALSFLPLILSRWTGKFIIFALSAIVAILVHGWYFFGPQIIYLLLITYIVSTIAELVSLKTRLNCFGVRYRYNLKHPFFSTKIRILGVYPLEVSLAWVILKYLSFVLALLISEAFHLPRWISILLIPLVLVSLDFILDPVSVNVSKLWKWERGMRYFGIPWQNFLGWYLVGLVAALLYVQFDGLQPISANILHILPILFYGAFLRNRETLSTIDKTLATLSVLPALLWVVLSVISLGILFYRA